MRVAKIAGVMRAQEFSPGHEGADAAIFLAVCSHLKQHGCEVELLSEEQFPDSSTLPDAVVCMGRKESTLRRLQELEDSGVAAINPARGIGNCSRERITRLLPGAGVPYPESIIVEDTTSWSVGELWPCWIKRADSCTQCPDHIAFCRNSDEALKALREFAGRGIKKAVINRHIEGEWIKFYGVAGAPFFRCYLPASAPGSEISEETRSRLHTLGEKAARALGVTIYGGDCILSADGQPVIIDLNDWPSFSPCREEAAASIAGTILNCIRKHSDND